MSRLLREQTPRERLEGNVLVLIAQTYLSQPLRVAQMLSASELAPEHFSDAVVRDVFRQLLPRILSREIQGECLNALHILGGSPNVEGNLEELIAELRALGPLLELEVR